MTQTTANTHTIRLDSLLNKARTNLRAAEEEWSIVSRESDDYKVDPARVRVQYIPVCGADRMCDYRVVIVELPEPGAYDYIDYPPVTKLATLPDLDGNAELIVRSRAIDAARAMRLRYHED